MNACCDEHYLNWRAAERALARSHSDKVELQQRIDRALELCDRGLLIHAELVRSVLTGAR